MLSGFDGSGLLGLTDATSNIGRGVAGVCARAVAADTRRTAAHASAVMCLMISLTTFPALSFLIAFGWRRRRAARAGAAA
jgi:hypothetical protein